MNQSSSFIIVVCGALAQPESVTTDHTDDGGTSKSRPTWVHIGPGLETLSSIEAFLQQWDDAR